MLARAGRLLEPDELARAARTDPGMIGPGAQFRWRRDHEPPSADEGFDAIERVTPPRALAAGARPAMIVAMDEAIWHGRPSRAADVRIVDDARAQLDRWRAGGAFVAGTAWLPGVPAAEIDAIVARAQALLGGDAFPIACCAHPAGPPVCWCRKPLPGLGLALARAHDLDLARSSCVGRGAAERGFAARLGARFEAYGGASTDV